MMEGRLRAGRTTNGIKKHEAVPYPFSFQYVKKGKE